MRFRPLLLVVALAVPIPAALVGIMTPTADAGDATALSERELRRAVTGKTVYLDISGFELPIHYQANGSMSGSMGTVAATFSLGDPSSDNGRWWIDANQLCQQWARWLDGQTYCYKLTRQGETVRWLRNDGRSGTVRLVD